ncbi:hypothetical protein PCE1_004439 [Barthelona sp. PCE]
MEEMRIIDVEMDTENFEKIVEVRYKTLRQPLGMEYQTAYNNKDEGSIHLACVKWDPQKQEEQVIGVVSMHPLNKNEIQLFQMASLVPKKGIGRLLWESFEKKARKMGYTTVIAHARCVALDFYIKLGFTVFGEQFTEVGIPHRNVSYEL